VVFLSLVDPGYQLIPKYLLFLLPPYLILVARGLMACSEILCRTLRSCTAREKWSESFAFILPVLLMSTLGIAPLLEYYRWDKEDWRDAAAYLYENMAQADILVSDGEYYEQGRDSYRAIEGLPYYFSLLGSEVTILEAQKGLSDRLTQVADPAAGVWGVLYHQHDLRDPGQLGKEFGLTEFPQVAVVGLSEPQGNTLQDTASILQALVLLQPSVVGRFDLHLALAELYQGMGLPEEAIVQATLAGRTATEYERQVERDAALMSKSWGWRPYWDLAATFERLGMLHEATAAYQEVLSADPALVQGYVRIGTVYLQSDQPAPALTAFQHALDIDPANARAHLLLGQTYQGLGRIEEAIQAYGEVLTINPEDQWTARTVELLSRPLEEEIPHPLLHSLGREIALLGYDLSPETVDAGSALNLTLWWQALADMDQDYTAFIHLTGPDDRIWAQEDMLLLDGQRPTSGWRLGDVVKEGYQLQVPTEAPPGQYTVNVGLYFWETGERLPVWSEQGHRQSDDVATLTVVTVTTPYSGD
jgi:tetratricopeptide (TPR) repeat protein